MRTSRVASQSGVPTCSYASKCIPWTAFCLRALEKARTQQRASHAPAHAHLLRRCCCHMSALVHRCCRRQPQNHPACRLHGKSQPSVELCGNQLQSAHACATACSRVGFILPACHEECLPAVKSCAVQMKRNCADWAQVQNPAATLECVPQAWPLLTCERVPRCLGWPCK